MVSSTLPAPGRWSRHQKFLWDLIEKPDTSPAAKWMSYIRCRELWDVFLHLLLHLILHLLLHLLL